MPNTYIVGASEYGGSGHSCPRGPNDVKGMAFAELNMGTALGNLPCGTQLEIEVAHGGGALVVATKVDIGLGGGPVQGHARRIDLWEATARAIGLHGTDLVRIKRVDGKPIIGPSDKEKASEAQGTGVFGTGVGPDVAPESSETLKNAVEGIGGWAKELGKILHFLGSSAGWTRIGKVAFGLILIVIAIGAIVKDEKPGLPKPRPAPVPFKPTFAERV